MIRKCKRGHECGICLKCKIKVASQERNIINRGERFRLKKFYFMPKYTTSEIAFLFPIYQDEQERIKKLIPPQLRILCV